MHSERLFMQRLWRRARSHEQLCFFLKYCGLFWLLYLAVASACLYNIIATESNPFFYARF